MPLHSIINIQLVADGISLASNFAKCSLTINYYTSRLSRKFVVMQ